MKEREWMADVLANNAVAGLTTLVAEIEVEAYARGKSPTSDPEDV